ncbi:hypothetical protein EGJ34_04010 [Stenotrophomonas sp. 278]|nr:hypothetical protein EGJ34_04010 [Stenotrophomonas sp. 278]
MLGISGPSSVDRRYRGHVLLNFVGHRPTVEGGSGWAGGGVSRMDAAIEATWTYLRRPPERPSRAAKPGIR